jgi:hypothetical protein
MTCEEGGGKTRQWEKIRDGWGGGVLRVMIDIEGRLS